MNPAKCEHISKITATFTAIGRFVFLALLSQPNIWLLSLKPDLKNRIISVYKKAKELREEAEYARMCRTYIQYDLKVPLDSPGGRGLNVG